MKTEPAPPVVADDPWKIASIVWPALVAALMPLRLHEVIERLPRLCVRLRGYDALAMQRAPTQLELFRRAVISRARAG